MNYKILSELFYITTDMTHNIISEGCITEEMEIPLFNLLETFISMIESNRVSVFELNALNGLIFACEYINCSNNYINRVICKLKSIFIANAEINYKQVFSPLINNPYGDRFNITFSEFMMNKRGN